MTRGQSGFERDRRRRRWGRVMGSHLDPVQVLAAQTGSHVHLSHDDRSGPLQFAPVVGERRQNGDFRGTVRGFRHARCVLDAGGALASEDAVMVRGVRSLGGHRTRSLGRPLGRTSGVLGAGLLLLLLLLLLRMLLLPHLAASRGVGPGSSPRSGKGLGRGGGFPIRG